MGVWIDATAEIISVLLSVKQRGLTSGHQLLSMKCISPAKTEHTFWKFEYSLWKELCFAEQIGVSGGESRGKDEEKREGAVISARGF